jgi:hypothetical protein
LNVQKARKKPEKKKKKNRAPTGFDPETSSYQLRYAGLAASV